MDLSKRKQKVKQQKQYWEQQKKILIEEQKLAQDRAKYIKKKKISTSKIFTFFLFANCTIVELFTIYITLLSFSLAKDNGGMIDFTPIVTLIGAVVGEVISFAIYSIKAAKENSQGGIVYEAALRDMQRQNQSMNNLFDEENENYEEQETKG